MHAIVKQTCDEDRPGDCGLWKGASYATAVFPTLALLNHSCDPNITKVFSGTTVYVVAGRNINKGEEVTENYFPFYTVIPLEERRDFLSSHYKFDCLCLACDNNYPLIASGGIHDS